MPMPRAVARFNRVIFNPIVRRFAGRVAPTMLVRHKGRKSGTTYQTPVFGFLTADGFIIALTYGPGADWVRNVLAAGGCEVEYRNRRMTLTDPALVAEDPRTQPLPGIIQRALGLMKVRDFLTLRVRSAQD